MNQWTSVVGGDGMLQVEEENKLKRKWVQTFTTEMLNGFTLVMDNMYTNLPFDLSIVFISVHIHLFICPPATYWLCSPSPIDMNSGNNNNATSK